MGHIFISYCHQDARFARLLEAQLEEAQFSVWRDPDLRAGESWRDEIDGAVREAAALIVVMSPGAKASPYVNYEWAFALGAEITVVPLLLGLPPEQLHPRLAALQALDFTDPLGRPWSELFAALGRITDARRPAAARAARGAPAVIRQAAAGLDSLDPAERSQALETLRQMDHPAAREVLAGALQHPVREVRIGAAYVVSELKDPRAIPELLEVARNPRTGNAHYEVYAYHLARIGPPAVSPLIEALADPSAGVRAIAAGALGQIGDPAAVAPLTRLLEDAEEDVRAAAVVELGRFGSRAPVAAMAECLRDASAEVRSAAAAGLGQAGGVEAAAALAVAVHDPDRDVRNRAVVALAAVRDRTAVPALIEALRHDAYDQTRQNAARALGAIADPAAVPALLQAVRDDSGIVRSRACEVLAAIGGAEAIAGLAALLADPDERTRRDAAGALERIATPAALEALRQARLRAGQQA